MVLWPLNGLFHKFNQMGTDGQTRPPVDLLDAGKKYIHMQAPFSPLSVVGLSPLACMAWQQLPLPLLNSNLDYGPKCVALSYRLPMQ